MTALPYNERPADRTPIHTADLPPTPVRDRNIVAGAWIEAPELLLHLTPEGEYKRRIGPWLLWRSGPASGADACYVAIDSRDVTRTHTFRLFPDGNGDGTGPDGSHHTRFRTWKESLRDNP